MPHDRRRSRLAIRSSDSQKPEFASGVAVGGGSGKRGSASAFSHLESWQRRSRRIFDDRQDCAALGGGIQIVMAIAIPAANGNEHFTRSELAAVVGNPACRGGDFSAYADQQATLGESALYCLDVHIHSRGRTN